MPARPGFQVALKLPSGTMQIPQQPITLPSGAYGIWPVNLDLPGTTLRYSTAQLFKQVQAGDRTDYFFFAIPGVSPELSLDTRARVLSSVGPVTQIHGQDGLRLRMSSQTATLVRLAGCNLIVLPQSLAEDTWRTDDPSLLVSTPAAFYADGSTWTFQSEGRPIIGFGIFGADAKPSAASIPLRKGAAGSLFHNYVAALPEVNLQPTITQVSEAAPRAPWNFGPKLNWRPTAIPIAPGDTDFSAAAVWKIQLPPVPQPAVSNVLLKISYQGDAARLYSGHQLIDDNFWNGVPWTVGLREADPTWRSTASDLELRILPLPQKYPMYLEKADALHFGPGNIANSLTGIQLVPTYRLTLQAPNHP
jgi:hypothetical protein